MTRSQKSIVYTDEVDGSDDDWSPEDEDEFDDEGEVDGSDDDWSPEDEDEDEDAQNGVTFETPK